jgi:hypothetical protein
VAVARSENSSAHEVGLCSEFGESKEIRVGEVLHLTTLSVANVM